MHLKSALNTMTSLKLKLAWGGFLLAHIGTLELHNDNNNNNNNNNNNIIIIIIIIMWRWFNCRYKIGSKVLTNYFPIQWVSLAEN